jgi:hypothetical protein
MQRAWGLHGLAHFKEIGDNRFIIRFTVEGDWHHVMKNGPWQFDFNVILLKDYAGSTRPSDMVFEEMDIWVRVLDLPMDYMNRAYGELIGNWIGKFISVEVDEDGMAWGEDLRVRVAMRVDQSLVRGVPLKDSDEDVEGKWFDIKYEKIPHFCSECGCLVHSEGKCMAEKSETQQWGEWLRASPRRNQKPPSSSWPSVSSGSYAGHSGGSSSRASGEPSIPDIPPRRNLMHDYGSRFSRTGEIEGRFGGKSHQVQEGGRWKGRVQ